MASSLFGSEFLPALKTLSKPIEALLPAGILIIFLVSPLLQGQILGSQLYLGDRILLCIIATYIGILFKISSGNLIRQAYTAVGSLTTSTEYVPAFKILSNLVGTYFKATFSTALACYTLHISNPSIPYALYVFVLALTAALVIGPMAPTKAFYGPLRWGYLQYSDFFSESYEILLNWWLCAALLSFLSPSLSSFLFPFLGLSILGASTAAWFQIYQDYHKSLQEVISQAAESTSRAVVAADFARAYASSTRQYEQQMLEKLAVTRRDVLLADSVNLTDFFDVAVESWAALEFVTDPFSDVVNKAGEIIDVAYDVEDSEKPTRGGKNELEDEDDDEGEEGEEEEDEDEGDDGGLSELAAELVEKAQEAVKTVKQVNSKLRVARRAVLTSREAKARTTESRTKAFKNAQEATSTTNQLLGKVAGALENCFKAVQGAEDTKRYAEKAVAAATMGEMKYAYSFAASAKKAADEVVTVKNMLQSTRDEARKHLFIALQTL